MIYEIAELEIHSGQAAEFEQAVKDAVPYFQAAQGYHSIKLEKTIESPTTYRLVVGWDSVEAHTEVFRNSDGFQQWRKLAGPFFASPPKVVHVDSVFSFDE